MAMGSAAAPANREAVGVTGSEHLQRSFVNILCKNNRIKMFKSHLYDDYLNNKAARVYSVQSAADRGCTVTAEHGSRWVAWLASHSSTW